jgi:hypothetical protein
MFNPDNYPEVVPPYGKKWTVVKTLSTYVKSADYTKKILPYVLSLGKEYFAVTKVNSTVRVRTYSTTTIELTLKTVFRWAEIRDVVLIIYRAYQSLIIQEKPPRIGRSSQLTASS